MTLLPSATHIDIATAMALWILADYSQQGVVARMTARVETSYLGGTPHSLDVILQRLMPLYRLRQTGESTTLLPAATHIDIAAAMALWILRHGTSCGEYRRRMTAEVMVLGTLDSTRC